MKARLLGSRSRLLFLFAMVWLSGISLTAQVLKPGDRNLIAGGWHPWYEIKVDPENANSLIICGTKWDAARNTPFGFVYASSDEGATWRIALVDRSTPWVTEHSCAFGAHHRAYLVSEASEVVDGTARHEFGTTRLFASDDGGNAWQESAKTGWADYSTSAVSSLSGNLYTFYNSWNTADHSKGWGSTVSLIVFPSNGRKVKGPFIPVAMKHINYVGAFPSNAAALKDGSVVALYYGVRKITSGRIADLGVVRASSARSPSLRSTLIAQLPLGADIGCETLSDNTMAYDAQRNRLLVVYLSKCGDSGEIKITVSDDYGQTWSKPTSLIRPEGTSQRLYAPSVAIHPNGEVAVLWEQGTSRILGHWCFALLKGNELAGSQVQLSRGLNGVTVSSDALETTVHNVQPNAHALHSPDSTISLNVFNQRNTTWRVSGLAPTTSGFLAVWPSGDADSTGLYTELLGGSAASASTKSDSPTAEPTLSDVTGELGILYGGEQTFDRSTGTLKVCLELLNRGHRSLAAPMKLQAEDIQSGSATISILNASNRLPGPGAVWDISTSATGERIPPGSTSNPFCLFFHLDIGTKVTSQLGPDHLLQVRMRVLASINGNPDKNSEVP